MSMVSPLWHPRYALTPAIARALMDIEAVRAVVGQTALPPAAEAELRRLDHRARTVLALFAKAEQITTSQVAATLGLSERMSRLLLNAWVKDGWLVITNPSNRKRAYGLSAIYRQYISCFSAMHEDERET